MMILLETAPPIRPIKALGSIALRLLDTPTAHIPRRLLRGLDLGLESLGVGVDPLQLRQVAVQDADNLRELHNSKDISKPSADKGLYTEQNIPDHHSSLPSPNSHSCH